ncbi:hypothetical protein [Desulfosporosinus lacus]|nr:hypothetical protein [Desulfosporosinus lacus]
MLSLCAIGGAAVFIFLKLPKSKANLTENLAEKTANEFVNVRDIRGNLLYTLDGIALCFLKVSPISIDLYSKHEKLTLMRTLTAEVSSVQHDFQFLAVSRPIDISPLLMELTSLLETADLKQKELLKQEIAEMNAYAISGEIVERQFYIILWDRLDDDGQRELLNRAKQFAQNFIDCGVECELLPQQEIVRLCNLVNNPAYTHLEDSDTEPAIPIIENKGA